MVGAHLPAVDRVFQPHALLDEGVAGLALHRFAPQGLDDIDGVPHQPGVVHHPPGSLQLEEGRRQQPHHVVALDKIPVLVKEEAAVEIAVPGDAHVGPVLAHGIDRRRAVLRQQRVGYAVGEIAVRLVMQLDELEGQVRLQQVHHAAGAAIAGIHHDLQRLESGHIHVGQQVFHVGPGGIQAVQAATLWRRGELIRFRRGLDVQQAGIAGHGPGLLAHELHAVVVPGVMAGRHRDTAVQAGMGGGEVYLLGARQADVMNIHPLLQQALHQGALDRLAGQPDVVSHHHLARPDDLGIGAPYAPGDILVQLVRHPAADVVGLEAGKLVHRHAPLNPPRRNARRRSWSPLRSRGRCRSRSAGPGTCRP